MKNRERRRYISMIKLSNLCREFYKQRKTEYGTVLLQQKLNSREKLLKLHQLNNEMNSLMDIDLVLTRQLIALDEPPIPAEKQDAITSCHPVEAPGVLEFIGAKAREISDNVQLLHAIASYADVISKRQSSPVHGKYPDTGIMIDKSHAQSAMPYAVTQVTQENDSQSQSSVHSTGDDGDRTLQLCKRQQHCNERWVESGLEHSINRTDEQRNESRKRDESMPPALKTATAIDLTINKPAIRQTTIKYTGIQLQTDITNFNINDFNRNNPFRKNRSLKI
ncbi:unnamed protein product [Owenia fusiformis]|uniref:Uncharacterized protein n=1 Tax=Owenia fusiformis TaxID=6347 RepID=A0A8S4NLW1_OWEFU|nr:unnamed protein product [Owenia fusiformis]